MKNNRLRICLEGINNAQINMAGKKRTVEHLRGQYKTAVAPYEASIRDQERQVYSLRMARFSVSLESILRGIAKEWGVDRDSLMVKLSTNQDHAKMYEYDASDFLDDILRNPHEREHIAVYAMVCAERGDGIKRLSIAKVVNLDDKLADGTYLWEHVRVDASKKRKDYNTFALRFDSLDNVLFHYTLDDLLTEPTMESVKATPKNEYSRAVLNAIEDSAIEVAEEDEAE